MELRQALTHAFAAGYPREAAAAIEFRPAGEAAQILRTLSAESAAGVLQSMAVSSAAAAMEQLEKEIAAALIAHLPVTAALPLLRRINDSCRKDVMASLPADRARTLKSAIGFPEGTAGALMDSAALAIPLDLTVAEALKTVRRAGKQAHDDLCVVDRDNRLAGTIRLLQLLQADTKARIETIMRPSTFQICSDDDRLTVERHPGWGQVCSLPVVDRKGRFLGVVSYETLKNLESERQTMDKSKGVDTARELGGLFWTGISAIFDAVASTVSRPDQQGARQSQRGSERTGL